MSIQTMIVDDDPIFAMMFKKIIARESFFNSPKEFGNGLLASEHLKSTYDPSTSYIIFLDINMPVMNGWEFLAAISEFAYPKNTLVFIVTSSINQADLVRSKENEYVIKFLTKPILSNTIIELKKSIKERLAD